MKEKLKKKKKIEKEKGKKESLEKILVIFFVFGNEISLSNCYLKSLFEKKKWKRNWKRERKGMQNRKKEERKTERRKR